VESWMNDGGFMAISPLNPSDIFYTGNVYDSAYSVGVSHSSDGGTTWEHDTIRVGTRGWAVAFDGVDTNRIYVGGDSAYSYPCLLISTDRGATWTQSREGLVGVVNVLMTVPGNGQLVYAGTGTGLFISTDAGATWEPTDLTGSVRTLVCDPGHPTDIFAGTYNSGVWASTDGGTTWTEMNDGLTCNKVLSLAFRTGTENTIYAGTEGGSVFKTELPAGISGRPTFDNRQSSIAISPNPCAGLTNVSLASSLLSPHSSLSIYDASGRLVRTFEVRTSCFALRTSGLEPGAYFVRVRSGHETRTSRLTIVD
jgi:photosystem II stability/assembly factor-like uncharacterized protein